MNGLRSDAIGKLKFSDNTSEFERKGFLASLDEKYKFTMDGENPVVRDSTDTLIQSEAKAGERASYEEVIAKEFEASKLGQVVDPKKVTTFTPKPGSREQAEPSKNGGLQVAERHN